MNESLPSEPVLDDEVEISAEPMGDGRTIRYYRWPAADAGDAPPAEDPEAADV